MRSNGKIHYCKKETKRMEYKKLETKEEDPKSKRARSEIQGRGQRSSRYRYGQFFGYPSEVVQKPVQSFLEPSCREITDRGTRCRIATVYRDGGLGQRKSCLAYCINHCSDWVPTLLERLPQTFDVVLMTEVPKYTFGQAPTDIEVELSGRREYEYHRVTANVDTIKLGLEIPLIECRPYPESVWHLTVEVTLTPDGSIQEYTSEFEGRPFRLLVHQPTVSNVGSLFCQLMQTFQSWTLSMEINGGLPEEEDPKHLLHEPFTHGFSFGYRDQRLLGFGFSDGDEEGEQDTRQAYFMRSSLWRVSHSLPANSDPWADAEFQLMTGLHSGNAALLWNAPNYDKQVAQEDCAAMQRLFVEMFQTVKQAQTQTGLPALTTIQIQDYGYFFSLLDRRLQKQVMENLQGEHWADSLLESFRLQIEEIEPAPLEA